MRLSDGTIRTDYVVKVRTMEDRPRRGKIRIDGPTGAVLWNEAGDRGHAGRLMSLDLAAGPVAQTHLFVATDAPGPAHSDLAFVVRALDREGGGDSARTVFERPE